jgi:isopenicillin N synthase-like dioxygenase
VTTIPLIDMTRWRGGSAAERTALAAEVDAALQEWGFLMVSGHGIAEAKRAEIRAAVRRFFALPESARERYATVVGGRGWIPPGKEANSYYGVDADPGRPDLKETFTMGRDFATGDPAIDAEWFLPNVWPGEVPELQSLCLSYAAEARGLFRDLLEIMAVALGLDPNWFLRRCLAASESFNVNRYPPRSETGAPAEGQFRIGPHTDWGTLTILDRQPGYGGLQVETTDGSWVDAPFVPDAFTVNIGDLMARWTGDRWRSTRHRVLPPSDQAPDEELISLILFYEADVETVVDAFPAPIGRTTHEPITAGKYLRDRTLAATVG